MYKACFLDKLDFPSREPAVGSALHIDHWHIPAEPFQTLPQRICRTLQPDGCGKTYNEKLGESLGKAGKKRKRDVASEECTSALKRI